MPINETKRLYNLKHREEIRRKANAYYAAHRDEICAKNRKKKYKDFTKEKKESLRRATKKWRDKNPEKQKQYRIKRREKSKIRWQQYKKKNWKKIREKNHRYYRENREKISRRAKIRYANNKDRIILYRKTHREETNRRARKNRQTNLEIKIKVALRNRMTKVLRGKIKASTTMDLCGCTVDVLKKHLESRFQDTMTWENYGTHGWHIDHILPCASFDLTKPEEQKKCFHYTNLQPLWAYQNLEKHSKLNYIIETKNGK